MDRTPTFPRDTLGFENFCGSSFVIDSATPRPYEQWRKVPPERAEDAAYTFAYNLMQHCRSEGSMKPVRSSISIASGLPRETVRSAPAITFSGPAQRSLTLRPARSRSRQATLSIESSDSFVASAADSIATGWSEPVPGREFHPLESSAFHGARFRQLWLETLFPAH